MYNTKKMLKLAALADKNKDYVLSDKLMKKISQSQQFPPDDIVAAFNRILTSVDKLYKQMSQKHPDIANKLFNNIHSIKITDNKKFVFNKLNQVIVNDISFILNNYEEFYQPVYDIFMQIKELLFNEYFKQNGQN